MVYKVVPRDTLYVAIPYDGTNFLEIKRYVGERIEKANHASTHGPLLLDTPYGVQRVSVGDVIVHQDKYWRAITEDEFNKRYMLIR